ncbi:B12-binding domain-containing radical SAM protein [candidate division KSB1 bacterium]
MKKKLPRSLLVNPWVYDFAAFDLWSKPLGLLYIAAVLREQGWDVQLLDCMDRLDSELTRQKKPSFKKHFTGKYDRHIITRPAVLSDIKRRYSRYGLPVDFIKERLRSCPKPDIILITSGMIYWYPALIDMVKIIREFFNDTLILLGGIYATLVPDHARKNVPVDAVIEGEAENALPELISESYGFDFRTKCYNALDDLPYPAFDLYPELVYLPVLTSRGCPLRCSFCASYRVSGKFRMRSVESVVEEISYFHEKTGVKHYAFYDDALLFNKETHILPILDSILNRGLKLRFHAPNGLQAGEIDRQCADMMKRAGFTTLRLSLETTAVEREKDLSWKVNPDKFIQAVDALADAGFERETLEAYILMGLPEQKPEEVIESVYFTAQQGVVTKLAAFSPIPGTKDWDRALKTGDLSADADLVETNNTVYINRTKNFGFDITVRLKDAAQRLNACVRDQTVLPDLNTIKKEVLYSRK